MSDAKTREERTKKTEYNNIDMLEIQIYADRCHGRFILGMTFGIAILAFWALYADIYYHALATLNLSQLTIGTFGMGIIGIIVIAIFWFFAGKYRKDFKKICEIIESVKKGEILPTLNKLDEWITRKMREKERNPSIKHND